jgi:signal transduction histidine kinase
VTVEVERNSDLEIIVSDQGPGVPESIRGTLFDRFTRGDAARGRSTGGAGLGLSLSQVIVEAHHGHIELDQQNGGGARFRVHLPATLETAG